MLAKGRYQTYVSNYLPRLTSQLAPRALINSTCQSSSSTLRTARLVKKDLQEGIPTMRKRKLLAMYTNIMFSLCAAHFSLSLTLLSNKVSERKQYVLVWFCVKHISTVYKDSSSCNTAYEIAHIRAYPVFEGSNNGDPSCVKCHSHVHRVASEELSSTNHNKKQTDLLEGVTCR